MAYQKRNRRYPACCWSEERTIRLCQRRLTRPPRLRELFSVETVEFSSKIRGQSMVHSCERRSQFLGAHAWMRRLPLQLQASSESCPQPGPTSLLSEMARAQSPG